MKIFLAGHNGMVGRAILRLVKSNQLDRSINIITAPRNDLDLMNQESVKEFFKINKPDAVIIAAAKVGGILANNTYPAEFIYQNLMIQNNIIHSSYLYEVKKLLFLGSSCIYPKLADQPMSEDELLSGKLEPTNEPYAIAKIAGIKMCESYNRQYGVDYRSIMPTNLYGPWDNFHPENSHVVPGLIRRFHEAKLNKDNEIKIWGTGKPLREFLHVDDMASASLFVLNLDHETYKLNTRPRVSHINVGSGDEISIFNLSTTISKIVGYDGKIVLDKSKEDGPQRKLLSTKKLEEIGWKAKIDLQEGITQTYKWYIENQEMFN